MQSKKYKLIYWLGYLKYIDYTLVILTLCFKRECKEYNLVNI